MIFVKAFLIKGIKLELIVCEKRHEVFLRNFSRYIIQLFLSTITAMTDRRNIHNLYIFTMFSFGLKRDQYDTPPLGCTMISIQREDYKISFFLTIKQCLLYGTPNWLNTVFANRTALLRRKLFIVYLDKGTGGFTLRLITSKPILFKRFLNCLGLR